MVWKRNIAKLIICTTVMAWSSVGTAYSHNLRLSECDASSEDEDKDGVSDALEDCLAERYAPVIYLPINRLDPATYHHNGAFPSSVEWIMARSKLGFNHGNGCRDDFDAIKSPSMDQLISRSHRVARGSGTIFCPHANRRVYSNQLSNNSWEDEHHFFLAHDGSNVKLGNQSSSDWPVYTHVYPTNSGVDIEYWYFYPFNNNLLNINHEGDWEHIRVSLNKNLAVSKLTFYQHNHSKKLHWSRVQWFDNDHGHHPLIWVADGSHASYPRNNIDCNFNPQEGLDDSCRTDQNSRWFTWKGGKGEKAGVEGKGLINVGEVGHILNGQIWLNYSGRWGRVGDLASFNPDSIIGSVTGDDSDVEVFGLDVLEYFGTTSGPKTPSMQAAWGANQVAHNPHDFDLSKEPALGWNYAEYQPTQSLLLSSTY